MVNYFVDVQVLSSSLIAMEAISPEMFKSMRHVFNDEYWKEHADDVVTIHTHSFYSTDGGKALSEAVNFAKETLKAGLFKDTESGADLPVKAVNLIVQVEVGNEYYEPRFHCELNRDLACETLPDEMARLAFDETFGTRTSRFYRNERYRFDSEEER